MTCVVGLKDAKTNQIVLGADSLGSNGASCARVKDPKIFRNGDLWIGYAGTFRGGQLLRYSLKIKAIPKTAIFRWMIQNYAEGLRSMFKQTGRLHVESGLESAWPLSHIVVVRGHLFTVQTDFSVLEYRDGYCAVGSGEQFANGALHATKGEDPVVRVKKALAAAAHHDPSVGGPFSVRSIPIASE